MTRQAELERIAGRRRPSEAERRIAARIVVAGNRAAKRPTPEWIQRLAKSA